MSMKERFEQAKKAQILEEDSESTPIYDEVKKSVKKNKQKDIPADYKPSITLDGTGHGEASLVSKRHVEPGTEESQNLFDAFLVERGYDPKKYFIPTESVKISQWQTYDERWLYAYKFAISPRLENMVSTKSIFEDLAAPVAPEKNADTIPARLLFITDTHIGKGAQAGGGTDQLIQQWKRSVAKALGDDTFDELHVAFGGDLIEGYISQNGRNIIQCDLTLIEQIDVAIGMVEWTLNVALGQAEKVSLSIVPGNHGETTRTQGVINGDSLDILIVQQAYERLARTWGTQFEERVDLIKPTPTETHCSWSVGDSTVTMVHGHKFKGQIKGADNWWRGHTFSGLEPGKSSILLAGHFHNFQISNAAADRWILFGPALETKSQWFEDSSGTSATSGVLIFDVVDGKPDRIRIV